MPGLRFLLWEFMKRPALKDINLEHSIFSFRLLVMLIMVLSLIGVLTWRQVYLQVLQHDRYTDLAKNNRVRLSPLPPVRGLIYDRRGVLLADNYPTFSLDVVPELVEDLPNTLSLLGEIIDISEEELAEFEQARRRSAVFRAVPLALNLDEEELARFYVEQYRFPGVSVQARMNRSYPQNDLLGHVLGYVGRINDRDLQRVEQRNYQGTTFIGKVGIERYYETLLHGRTGFREEEVNSRGRPLREIDTTPAGNGSSLVLTIDTVLQKAVQEILGDESGAVVALDPRNGEVLALYSNPTYDPNAFVNGISTKDYALLRDDPERPLFNRAIQGRYPPGSTVKPVMALAGLNEGIISADQRMFATGFFQVPKDPRKYRDWKRSGHGWVDMYSAIAVSADVYFYDLAYQLGIDRIAPMFGQFGFGKKTGIGIYGEASGLLPTRQWKQEKYNKRWFPGETLIVGIGQGYMLATPVQLARMVGCIAMKGRCEYPRLVRAILSSDTDAELLVKPTADTIHVKDEKYWDEITRAMVEVMHGDRGTARKVGADARYTMAGKTGTSQVFSLQGQEYDADKLARRLHDHSMFVGFAPADDPKIAVAVVIEHGGSGSKVAAPIGRQVMDAWLDGGSGRLVTAAKLKQLQARAAAESEVDR